MGWKQTLLAFAGVASDDVTKKQKSDKAHYKSEVGDKESPLRAEFTGDKFPTDGKPEKHEQSAWKEMNRQFQTLKGKGEPKPTPNKKEFGSPLTDKTQGGRAEELKSKEELGKGAEPEYKTGQKKPMFRIGAKFGALKTNSIVTINAVGIFGKFKAKVASNEITYLDPTGKKQPESDNMVVVAYRHAADGKTYAAKVIDFFGAFVPLEKRAHKLDETAQTIMTSDISQLGDNLKKYIAYDEPQYLQNNVLLCQQLEHQFSEAAAHHGVAPLDESEMSISSSQKQAKSPPHSEYTMHELKKNKKINPWAVAWDMKNKGKHLHEKKPKDSAWKTFLQRLADAVNPVSKGKDEFPDGGKGDANSWTNEMLDVAEIMDKDADTRGEHFAGRKQGYTEAFKGAAPPFGSPEREEWESGKKKEPEPTKDGQEKPDDQSKEAAVDFTQKPDGTINIAVEGLPDVPVQPQDMGAMEAPVAGGNVATPVTTPAATKGKSSSLIGRKLVDPILGNGEVIAVEGNRVIASFADGKYETTIDKLS